MQSTFRNFWSAELAGPRTASRMTHAFVAILGIICIALVTSFPASGLIYYIILGVTTLWSALVSFFILNERTIHPGFAIALDLALAGMHFAFGIISSVAAAGTRHGNGNAIVAVFLLTSAVFHTLFFILACRDTHARRSSPIEQTGKPTFENHAV